MTWKWLPGQDAFSIDFSAYHAPRDANPVSEEVVMELARRLNAEARSDWFCSVCWGEVGKDQTECYRCGAELTTHPLDDE